MMMCDLIIIYHNYIVIWSYINICNYIHTYVSVSRHLPHVVLGRVIRLFELSYIQMYVY